MLQTHAPIITTGQLYLNAEVNEYLIVVKNNGGDISYKGRGFKGCAEDQTFIERFDPVDPTDVDQIDLDFLLSFCPVGTQAQTGFIFQG